MEKKEVIVTCILCPQGCSLELTKINDDYEVRGNKCKRGKEYAISEITKPMRTLTTTVKTVFKDFPRLSVKTDKEIPLKDIFIFMECANNVIIERRLRVGDIIIRNMVGTDVNLIATDDMECILN
jgi:CxxC motif-containing protein